MHFRFGSDNEKITIFFGSDNFGSVIESNRTETIHVAFILLKVQRK